MVCAYVHLFYTVCVIFMRVKNNDERMNTCYLKAFRTVYKHLTRVAQVFRYLQKNWAADSSRKSSVIHLG